MSRLLKLTKNDALILGGILEAASFVERLKGFMFQKKPMSKGILFRNCNSLHSYFMHFDIDLYFLDSQDQLVRIEKHFGKNRTLYVKTAAHVLEVPSEQLELEGLRVGDRLIFVSCEGATDI